MIRFIWKNWWRRKDRFLLLIIGALIISVGFTYFFGLSETSKGTIVDELQERWSSSYDIIVRPEGTRSVTEKDNLLDPNFLSGLTDGISLQQYEQIKNIPNVEVAAPIAMIGYTQYNVNLESLKFDEGIYRLRKEVKTEDIEEMNSTSQHYFASGNWNVFQENLLDKGYEYFLQYQFSPEWSEVRDLLLAGIDPEQEAKLIGLDDSIVKLGKSRYFTHEDTVSQQGSGSINDPFITNIPIILSNQSFSGYFF